jgi:large subunit ribosomal protein L35Ae
VPSSSAFAGINHQLLRSKVQQNENQSILRLQGVNDRTAAQWYFGKRVVYVYKSSSSKNKKFKTIWGRIATTHGNNGAVLARFAKNLPPRAIGSTLRVMLFPQRHL